MGYSYSYNNRLCCDYCGKAEGNTRKVRCPYDECPPPAMCKTCRADGAKRAALREYHQKNCKPQRDFKEYRKRLAQVVLDNGGYVREACGPEWVRDGAGTATDAIVLFRNALHHRKALSMPRATFEAIDVTLKFTTPEEYAQHGPLTEVDAQVHWLTQREAARAAVTADGAQPPTAIAC